MTTTRLLSGVASMFGAERSVPTDLSAGISRDNAGGEANTQRGSSSGERTVNVNVFGVRDVSGFLQSRAAVNRAMRIS